MSTVAALAGLAADNLAQGRPADALRLIDGAITSNSGERTLIALRAQALFALGDNAAACGAMAWLVAQEPDQAQAWVALGLLLQTARRSGAAEHAFLRAQVIKPGSRGAVRHPGRPRSEWADSASNDRAFQQAVGDARAALREAAYGILSAALSVLEPDQAAHWAARLLLGRAAAADGKPQELSQVGVDFAKAPSPDLPLAFLRHLGALDHPGFGRCEGKAAIHHGITALLAAKGLDGFPSYPASFLLPDEAEELAETEASGLWIVRPLSGAQPYLTRTPAAIGSTPISPALVQEYVARPLLLSGRKAHLRIYLAFPAPEWGRALLWDDGVVEFAPAPYASGGGEERDDPRHFSKLDQHAGNPAIDRQSADGQAAASIWSAKAYLHELGRQRGAKAAELAWANLARLARDTARLIDHSEILAAERQAPARWSYPPKILGIDCLLDEGLNAFLLDLERRPEFAATAPAERAVHARLGASFAKLCFAPDAGLPEGFILLYAPGV